MRTTKSNYRFVTSLNRLTIRILFLFFIPGLTAQVAEDFLDGNFTSDPLWTGDSAYFTVSSTTALPSEVAPSLRLSAENSDTSFLVLECSIVPPLEWRFLVKLSFNTSANNFARVYLSSDSPDLKGPLNGIYLQLGGGNDSLCLVKQQGLEHSIVFAGDSSFTGHSSNLFRIKVTRDNSGMWRLYTDPQGGCSFMPDGEAFDPDPPAGNYLGIYCRYTSSNATKFYFDDVFVQGLFSDTTAPVVDSVHVYSDTTLCVQFSEALDFISAMDTSHYFIGHGVGSPSSAAWDQNFPDRVVLALENPLPRNLVCDLIIEKIHDLTGNLLIQQIVPVLFIPPVVAKPFDVVINEIMADVHPPPLGLPAVEYIELFNRTDTTFPLEGYAIKPRESSGWLEFNMVNIKAGGYLVVSNSADTGLFNSTIPVVGLQGFSLNKEGSIAFRNRDDRVVQWLEYSMDWYEDEEKMNGGWSLEQIDPFRPCPGNENWIVSVAPEGGTPGTINSGDAMNPVPFAIEELFVEEDSVLCIVFNQVVSDSIAKIPSLYGVNRGVGSPKSVTSADPAGKKFRLIFFPPLHKGLLYELNLKPGMMGCTGESLQVPVPEVFGIPEDPEWNDVVINEILFNPAGPGVDFVELYNRSGKMLDLSHFQLGKAANDPFGVSDTNYHEVIASKALFLPGDFVVLTKDPVIVREQYFCGDPASFIRMNSFPSLPNEAGNVICSTHEGKIIDFVDYTASMHYPLLAEQDGVSLERIHYDRASSDRTNWHSAASINGFATPALVNSQFSENDPKEDAVYVDPEVFSPDNDGVYDVTRLCYRFDRPGFMARLLVYDLNGRLVRCLANNELLPSEGCFVWNGNSETGAKMPMGIYVFFLEVFNTEGMIRKYKKPVVVAGFLH